MSFSLHDPIQDTVLHLVISFPWSPSGCDNFSSIWVWTHEYLFYMFSYNPVLFYNLNCTSLEHWSSSIVWHSCCCVCVLALSYFLLSLDVSIILCTKELEKWKRKMTLEVDFCTIFFSEIPTYGFSQRLKKMYALRKLLSISFSGERY